MRQRKIKSSRAEYERYWTEKVQGRKATAEGNSVREVHSHGTDHPHSSQSGRDQRATGGKPRSRTFFALFTTFWQMLGSQDDGRSARRSSFGIPTGYQWSVILGIATLTVSTVLGLLPPVATKLAIDCVLTDPPHPLPGGIQRLLPDDWQNLAGMPLLTGIAVATVFITLVQTSIRLYSRWVSTRTVFQFAVRLRKRMFEHILRLPLHRLHSLKSGGATSVLREDAGGVADLIFSMLFNPWQAVVQLVGSLIVLVLVDWRLLVAGVLLIPFVYFSHRWYIQSIRPLYRDVRQQRQIVDGNSTESFGGIRVVRTFARQTAETNRFVRGNHLLVRQQLMVWWRTRLIEIIWEVLIPLASTGLLLYGGWQILQGQLTLGDLLMFLVYLTMLLGPIATLTGSAVQFQNNLAGLDRVLDILEQPQEMPDRPSALSVHRDNVRGDISFDRVSFRYPENETWIIRDLSMEVLAGQTIALVGRSGAGKTTLCNLVARFFDPDEGAIRLDGIDLRDVKLHSYRSLLGMVEQDVFLFDGTIAENIGFSRPKASMDEILQAAEAAAADEFIRKLPDGYESIIGERGVKLSGGQRQRLAIARAILADPKILILDEATSNLDSHSERLIQQSLERLRLNRTTFVIAHRLSTIISADQIWVMEEGEIIQSGSHASLMSERGAYREMVRLQTESPISVTMEE